VHRDVSTGNILTYNGQAKLADLEYAKKMGDLKSHEMRTASESPISLSGKSLIASQQGTMQFMFMSIEVAAQLFLFCPLNPGFSSTELNEETDQDEEMDSEGTDQDEGTAQTKVPFSHNHLHDLESLWWVAVWVVIHNYIISKDTTYPPVTLQDAAQQLEQSRILFPLRLESSTRRITFQHPDAFQELCATLPRNKKAICDYLNVLRRHLIDDYSAIEARFPESVDPNTSKDDIYNHFTRAFSKLKTLTDGRKLDFIPDIMLELMKAENLKRPRTESMNDTVAQKAQKMVRYV